MNRLMLRFIHYAFLLMLVCSTSTLLAQRKKTASKKEKNAPAQDVLSEAELDRYKQNIRHLVSFLEYTLNTIGSDSTYEDEKQIIINSSYLKIFRDEKVQVEDDLVDDRKVSTYKNVKAYLQDVDYFYKNVAFQLKIENIQEEFNDKNRLYFIVTLTRNLNGIAVSGSAMNNNVTRYIEINLDLKRSDLKIVSMYTNKISEEEELGRWWNSLPLPWKEVLKKQSGLNDSVDFGSLKRLVSTEELNVAGNSQITSLDPLSKLIRLKKLNLAGTIVNSLFPLRNLTNLELLIFNNTAISDLEPIRYFTSLKEIYADSTPINNLEVLTNLPQLEHISLNSTSLTNIEHLNQLRELKVLLISHTAVSDLNPLRSLRKLEYLDFSNTPISNISMLDSLLNLQQLIMSQTQVADINPLVNLKALKVLNISSTPVNSLIALKGSPALERIYCDNSKVDLQEAVRFMNDHPGVLVICGSELSMTWWSSLPSEWKNIFKKTATVSEPISKEELTSLINMETLDISGNEKVNNLSPIRMLANLKSLTLNNTHINNLLPVKELTNLKEVAFSGTEVSSLDPLWSLSRLKKVNCNNTKVDSAQVKRFMSNHPNTLVIYKTAKLESWWRQLSPDWKTIFKDLIKFNGEPTELTLHQLADIDTLAIRSLAISDLRPLQELNNLKVLSFTDTHVHDLAPLKNLKTLVKLECMRNPVKDLQALQSLSNLEYLDISNTGVQNLDALEKLEKLRVFICSGTPVKNLKPLSKSLSLQRLDISSTRISNLNALEDLEKIKFLSCFNTNISERQVNKFKEKHPGVEVVYY